jgi:hypothetical protein
LEITSKTYLFLFTEGDAGIKAETVQQWFASVYEPAYNVEQPEPEVRRQPEFDNGQPV